MRVRERVAASDMKMIKSEAVFTASLKQSYSWARWTHRCICTQHVYSMHTFTLSAVLFRLCPRQCSAAATSSRRSRAPPPSRNLATSVASIFVHCFKETFCILRGCLRLFPFTFEHYAINLHNTCRHKLRALQRTAHVKRTSVLLIRRRVQIHASR